jgi:DDE family transposase
MSRSNPLYGWTSLVTTHFPHLSKPQAAVLALWSFGMVLARSCALSAVATALSPLVGQAWNTVRERLRDWYKSAAHKSGRDRRELDVTTCFAPLLAWILKGWPCRQLALALDATSLFDRLTVLSLSVVYRGTAIPVAWKVLRANKRHAWKPELVKLLHWFSDQVDSDWTVLVLTDRGLYARWLFRAITGLGWHPMMRITRLGKFLPEGWVHPQPVWQFAPAVGRSWQGRGVAFPKKPERRLPCTLLAFWAPGHEDGWYVLTDLPPQAAHAAWYGLRMWIEHGFEQFKSAGWQWQKSRITAPDRASRVWLAMAVASLWVLSVGGQEDHTQGPRETLPKLPATHSAGCHRCREPSRLVSVLRQGIAALIALLIMGEPAGPGQWYPESWPELAVIIQEREHEQ